MSKVVIVTSSLRGKSNSDILANKVMEGAKEAGHDVEVISLKGKNINFCIGCFTCAKTGECVLKDDVKAMKDGDVKLMGSLLKESHVSLRDDYEVTGIHLDTIAESAVKAGAIGARMTGAGFGGCAIALINKNDFEIFKQKVEESYSSRLGIRPDVIQVDIVDGPSRVK